MPADHGLTSLGLLMQLGGALFLGLMVFLAVTTLYAGIFVGGAFSLMIITVLCAVRSAVHVSAGRALVHGSPSSSMDRPLSGIRRYIWVACAQTALSLLLLSGLVDHDATLVGMGATWLAWPAALLVVSRFQRLRAMEEQEIPHCEDHGFEGASIFMVVFGIIGALFCGLVLYQLLRAPGSVLVSFEFLSMFAIFGLLLARSLLHVSAGKSGIRGDLSDVTFKTLRYTRFAALSTVIIGVLLFVAMGRQGGHFLMFGFLALMVYLLLAWPRTIARFMDQSDVHRYQSNEPMRRPPDMGMTALGWLLLALSVHGLAGELPLLLWREQTMNSVLLGVFDNTPLSQRFDSSIGLSLLISGTQLWAAVSLIRMNNDHKLAPTVYGVVATAVTLYIVWPLFRDHSFFGVLFEGPMGLGGVTVIGQVGIALTVPLSAFMLVRREPVARAQARYRTPPDEPSGSES